ncbi:MAG: hypothetical protein N3G20_09500, partial [Verrucomicrobiae bacterium]|nr:hypothetical protein [Verrucomicrobiae bacterium]
AVGSVTISNKSTGTITSANEDGMFVLRARAGPNKLEVITPNYRALSNLVVNMPRHGSVRLDVPVEKTKREYGDVIETRWTLPAQSDRVAVGDKHIFYCDTNCTIKRLSFDSSVAEPLVTLPNIGITWANGSLYVVETYLNSFLYRVDQDGSVTVGPKLLTPWPAGLAFDGTNFWYLEFTGLHGSKCGLYAMAPSGEKRAHFISGISSLRSVAAGRGRLWLLADGRRVYEAVIPPGITSGQLDAFIQRSFPAKGLCLTYALDQLWILGTDKRSVQRIWLGD